MHVILENLHNETRRYYSKTIKRKNYCSYAEYNVRKVIMRDLTLSECLHEQRSSWRETAIHVSLWLLQSSGIVGTLITSIRSQGK